MKKRKAAKKFQDRQSVIGTHFEDLMHVVEEAMQFAYDIGSQDADTFAEDADRKWRLEERTIKVAYAFCKAQDVRRANAAAAGASNSEVKSQRP